MEKKAPKEGTDHAAVLSDLGARIAAAEGKLSPEELASLLRAYVDITKEAERRKKAEKRKKERESKKSAAPAEDPKQAEHVREVTSMELPLDWENAFMGDPRAEGVHTDSIPDGLILSLTTLGRVDVEYIAEITGHSCGEVISALRGSIYQNPDTWDECFYRGFETAEEYLSGNLLQKLRRAKEANKAYNGYFRENVKALKAALLPAVSSDDIYVTLGSPWLPTEVIDAFITHLFKLISPYRETKHNEETGTWELPRQSDLVYHHLVTATHTFGTPRKSAPAIIEDTLNMRPVTVYDTNVEYNGRKKRTVRTQNREETLLALEKQRLLLDEFGRWIFAEPKRKRELTELYESKYGCVRRRIFDGSFLTFPTMDPGMVLYPYQKNAVARILFSANTLLAHDVGSGKTYVMIAAGMELRRMGLSKKNLYVIPNALVGQWRDIFLSMYPQAKLLVVDPAHFTPSVRGRILERIRDEEFDGILMAYSCFEAIPVSRRHHEEELERELAALEKNVKEKSVTTQSKMRSSHLQKKLAELRRTTEKLLLPTFDELGIDRLFVDEAHNYKNLSIPTKCGTVNGISANGSKKCDDMLDKVHIVQKAHAGGGVVMATGTPITNSITDAFVMQYYLQSGELALLDLQHFDSWIGMFAERETSFEIAVDTNTYRMVTRFSKFHNLPELTSILASVADFHSTGPGAGLPAFHGYNDCLVPREAPLNQYLLTISKRADAVHAHRVNAKEDNMLKITNDGRRAALDIRLVEDGAAASPRSKVATCAANVYDIYKKTEMLALTQLVFCDISTPQKGFNIYDELCCRLVALGVRREEIAFIHDATTERYRSTLFARMRAGDLRILLGSTQKLGMGVNVQDRLVAIHHLDVPWRPADMTQREGRILRQGNTNSRVFIYRYITEGSFDAYSWQILETKQRFISGLLSGSLTERASSDIEGAALAYAEVKALAIGNPLIKERVELANELARTMTLSRSAAEERYRMEHELHELPAKIKALSEQVENCKQDCAFLELLREKVASPVPFLEDGTQALQEGSASQEDVPSIEEAPVAYTGEGEEAPLSAEEAVDERELLRERIFRAITSHSFAPSEEELGEYRGFRLLLPANLNVRHPFLFLTRTGRYAIDIGTTKGGILAAIDSFIDELPSHLRMLKEQWKVLKSRKSALLEALDHTVDYSEKIRQLAERLAKIDEDLGVKV